MEWTETQANLHLAKAATLVVIVVVVVVVLVVVEVEIAAVVAAVVAVSITNSLLHFLGFHVHCAQNGPNIRVKTNFITIVKTL